MMAVLRIVAACAVFILAAVTAATAAAEPALVPRPNMIRDRACAAPIRLDRPLTIDARFSAGGVALLAERWQHLGIARPRVAARHPRVVLLETGHGESETYRLTTGDDGVRVSASSDEGNFDALMTLAQLPVRAGAHWVLPCRDVTDAPALRWRIVSDDISRGPFPTLRYLRERIRTLASLKINGWSPYMEGVFLDPAHPYVAFPNALTADQLRDVQAYAARFHVTFIPQQQTFAHMHEALKYEQLAPLAELPHGYLVAESDARTYAYLEPLLRAELAAIAPAPFFHLGADEPIDLGRGRTPRTARVFADHVSRLAAVVRRNGTRPMIWDDAIQQDPTILNDIPKDTVIVTFHYGAEKTFTKYIATVADAGFAQMVSPGANNWNELFPDLATAYANEAQFIADGKAAHVLGMFETVWHDDGETLFEATWAPVAFAAASAWQSQPVDRSTWHATFARAFFGTDDPRFAADLDALESVRAALRTPPASDPSDYLFWSDPFDARIEARMANVDLAGIRARAEDVMAHLALVHPPLHAQAAAVMRLAALRYDALGRRFQIGKEARDYYDDARAHAPAHDDGPVYRGLYVAKYLCWEMRDALTALEPLYAQAWRYESTPAGLERVRVRYRLAEERAMTDADRLDAAAREDYLRAKTLPPFETMLGATR